ncbi:STAS domain-containing protein [Streptomyces avicenniae]|uniref:STAS domain-containing protein n=1 Tax=Streptomyces avicenniae TaxID=500153 RepID=UPI00167DBF48|nr:STAS domain-containing protein [Streptomyces avicenniae]
MSAEFVVWGPLVRADVPGVCARLEDELRRTGAGTVTVDLAAVTGAGAAAVDAVARLRLTAGRAGCRVRFLHVAAELRAVLTLVGLGELLADGG